MPTPQIAKQAEAVRADITRLDADLKTLLSSVGGAIGSSISSRVGEPLKVLAGHVEPLLVMLGAAGGAPAPVKRGPGRPRKDAGEAAPKKSRRGGRRKKANLTAEKIAAALKETGGNKSAAAKLLRVSQPTFYKYLGATKVAPAAKPVVSKAGKKTEAKTPTHGKSAKKG